MKLGTRVLALVGVTIGCSSANFDVTENPGADTSVAEEAGTDTGIDPALDSEPPPPDSNVGDSVVTEASTGCAVPSNPSEIWVDKASTAMGATGTDACPFRTVLEAVAFANTIDKTSARTIRVRNGIYTEKAAIILRKGLTLAGSGVGLTQLAGGGPCTTAMDGFHCVVRVDGGAILERVSIDAAPNGRHGVVTGEPEGAFPVVRSASIFNAGGSCCAGILATNGAILGPNIEASNNAYGLTIWGSQAVKILAGGGNKFNNNTILGINHDGTGALTIENGTVSNNAAGIKLGYMAGTLPPTHSFTSLTAKSNLEYGIRVTGVASLKLRSSTITGNKIGVIAIFGASNYVDLGNAGIAGGNNFGSPTVKNSLAAICAITRTSPLDATGNTFPFCSAPRHLDDISNTAGCEAITSYQDVWYRGDTLPIMASCTAGM